VLDCLETRITSGKGKRGFVWIWLRREHTSKALRYNRGTRSQGISQFLNTLIECGLLLSWSQNHKRVLRLCESGYGNERGMQGGCVSAGDWERDVRLHRQCRAVGHARV